MTAREELREMQAKAWKAVASRISVIELTEDPRTREIAVDSLIAEVNRAKKQIDKFIDSKTDAELEIGAYRKEN